GVVALEIDRDPLAVAVEGGGELAVRVPLVEKAKGGVESLLVGHPRRARLALAPFADDPGAIAALAQHFGDRHFLGAERHIAFGQAAVAADPRMTGVLAGQERRARRRTHRAAAVVLREPGPLTRELVDRRRLELRLAVGAEIAVAESGGLNQQNVRGAAR